MQYIDIEIFWKKSTQNPALKKTDSADPFVNLAETVNRIASCKSERDLAQQRGDVGPSPLSPSAAVAVHLEINYTGVAPSSERDSAMRVFIYSGMLHRWSLLNPARGPLLTSCSKARSSDASATFRWETHFSSAARKKASQVSNYGSLFFGCFLVSPFATDTPSWLSGITSYGEICG